VIEFALWVFIGATKIDDTHKFLSLHQCLTLAGQLSSQGNVPYESGGGSGEIKAYCIILPKKEQ
jgi:hypothetical protein